MKMLLDKDLLYEILSVVEEIPEGCVATYGQIARLIGREKNARLVGRVLSSYTGNIRAIGWLIMQVDLFPDGRIKGGF